MPNGTGGKTRLGTRDYEDIRVSVACAESTTCQSETFRNRLIKSTGPRPPIIDQGHKLREGYLRAAGWALVAVLAALVVGAIGVAVAPAWMLGNAQHCDAWFGFGQIALMGEAAQEMAPGARQTARVAGSFVGGFVYSWFGPVAGTVITPLVWLAAIAAAISSAALVIAGRLAFVAALYVCLATWPLYTFVATDYTPAGQVAWFSLALFGAALSIRRPHAGLIVAGAGVSVGLILNPVVILAAFGLLAAAFMLSRLGPKSAGTLRAVGAIAVGLSLGAAITVAIGNLVGSAPGIATLSNTWDGIQQFAGRDPRSWLEIISVGDVVTKMSLTGAILLLSAPGAGIMLRWVLDTGFRRRRAGLGAPLQVRLHGANLISLAAAFFVTAIHPLAPSLSLPLTAEFYVAAYFPLAVVSFAVVVGTLLRSVVWSRRRIRGAVIFFLIAGTGAFYVLWVADRGTLLGEALPPLAAASAAVALLIAIVFVLLPEDKSAQAPALAVGLLVLIAIPPFGYGAYSWDIRGSATGDNPNGEGMTHREIQSGAYRALQQARGVASFLGPVWWLDGSSPFFQERLHRATLTCSFTYAGEPDDPDAPASKSEFRKAAGPFTGAPGRVEALPAGLLREGQQPERFARKRSEVVPDGQGLVAVVQTGHRRTAIRQMRAALLQAGVDPVLESTALVDRFLVAAWRLRCRDGADFCRLDYFIPDGPLS